MEFGGDSGEILTFASYAQKEKWEELTCLGYMRKGMVKLFMALMKCCCCSCCREDKDVERTIEKKRSHVHEEGVLLQGK